MHLAASNASLRSTLGFQQPAGRNRSWRDFDYTWNYENQRILIVKPSGVRVTMALSADFRRVRKES